MHAQDFTFYLGPGSTGNNSNATTGRVCREDFYLGDDGLCRAECTQFEYWPHRVESAINIIVILSLAIGSTAAVVVITVSCIRRKRL